MHTITNVDSLHFDISVPLKTLSALIAMHKVLELCLCCQYLLLFKSQVSVRICCLGQLEEVTGSRLIHGAFQVWLLICLSLCFWGGCSGGLFSCPRK